MKKLFSSLFLGLALLAPFFALDHAHARDLSVLKLENCEYLKGFILAVDEDIVFLDLSGKIEKIREEQIKLVLTYGISQSPFPEDVKLDPNLNNYLKELHFKNSSSSIVGFPFQYIEDLVFIMGASGKTYVVGLGEISKIEDAPKNVSLELTDAKKFSFDYSDYTSGCLNQGKLTGTILRPIRVLGDKIKVSEFVEGYKKGYRSFIDLQERTKFYAKPYLYPKRNRLGVSILKGAKQSLPLYYQWSAGEDFHFQSVNAFGGKISKYLPLYDPSFVFSSEFKSHFFHGYFEGNLLGLSGGELPNDIESSEVKESLVLPNFNYMAFMGGDWQRFSFSYGGGYFAPLINFNNQEKRQVAANSLSNAVRIAYTGKRFGAKAIFYKIDDKSSSTFQLSDQMKVTSTRGIEVGDLSSYTFKADYYRGGFSFEAGDNITLETDVIVGEGEYEESGIKNSTIKFSSLQYLVSVQKQFGHYITLKALMRSSSIDMEANLLNENVSADNQETTYGGVFELLF